jgi:hypothetical protein
MSLKPDIIINYTGCNDLRGGDYPYINAYMRKISKYLETQNDKLGTRHESNPFGVTWGINSYSSENPNANYEFWFNNEKMVHLICSGYDIKHLTIHQPNLCNGKTNKSKYEKEYLINICYCGVIKQSIEDYTQQAVLFKNRVKESAALEDGWLVDLSDMFDDKDVYFDRAHVNEEGNRIIADEIFNILRTKEYI